MKLRARLHGSRKKFERSKTCKDPPFVYSGPAEFARFRVNGLHRQKNSSDEKICPDSCKLDLRNPWTPEILLDRVFQSWVKITQGYCEIWIQIWKLTTVKGISVLIPFFNKLMVGSSKNNRENYPRKCFWTKEKETRVKSKPRLSANRPSNNWALKCYRVARNTLSAKQN